MSGYGRDDYDGQQEGRRHGGGGGYGGDGDYGRQQGGGYGGDGDYGRQQGGGYGGGQQDDYGSHRHDDGGYPQQGGRPGGGNIPQGGNYGGGGGYGRNDDDDLNGAVHHAQQHAGDSGDSSLFSNIAGFLNQNKHNIGSQPVEEQSAVDAHKQFFGGGGGGGSGDSSSMGTAAAMQALKMFTGGGSGNSQGGNSQNAFIGMAMAEAGKLFDKQSSQGNISSGSTKESAIQQAGEMALKMYMQSQGGGSGGGGSGLLGLASKFF